MPRGIYADPFTVPQMSFSAPEVASTPMLQGREVNQTCCQIIPPHVIDKLRNSENVKEKVKERINSKMHLHHQARAQRSEAEDVAPVLKKIPKKITYTISDAMGDENFANDRVIKDFSDNIEAASLLDFSQQTMTFAKQFYNRDGIDGKNMPVVAYYNYGYKYDNAFWDGKRFFCGKGDGHTFGDFNRLDIVGHELWHGFNHYMNNFVYRAESGALDESFADVNGIMVKHRAQLLENPDLTMADLSSRIGEGLLISKIPNQYALRDMATGCGYVDHPDLGTDWQPIRMSDYYRPKDPNEDEGGVHTNSGIPNRLFWIIYSHPQFGVSPEERIGKLTKLYSVARDNLRSRSNTFANWGKSLESAAVNFTKARKKSKEYQIVLGALKETEFKVKK